MRRDLKFRAWDGNQMHVAFDLSQNPKYWWAENKDYPLMQYTGLKDKNSVEIYEGDIVKIGRAYTSPKSVVFKGGQWAFDQKSMLSLLGEMSVSDIEVIGNMYENPDLLEPSA